MKKIEMTREKVIKKMISELYKAFDFGFSDGYRYKGENVREDTFKNRFKDLVEVRNIIEADSIVNFALVETLGNEHPSAKLWLESETDLKASIYLSLGGYYRQALGCLRNWLEITLIGIYYSEYYKGKNSRFEQFINGKRQAPIGKNLFNSLFERKSLKKADSKIGLRSYLANLYNELSSFIHCKGTEQYKLQDGRDNVPRFLKRSFDIWFEFLKKVIRINVLILIITYCKELSSYFGDCREEFNKLENILKEKLFSEILFSKKS